MPTLQAIATTFLKPDTRQSADIPKERLISFKKGETLKISEWGEEKGHIWIKRKGDPLRQYVWKEHVKVIDSTAEQPPATFNLNVPYLSQLDNKNNPGGSCNVTSVAMCLGYLGHPLQNSDTGEQLEDELYRYMLDNGLSRHKPDDLAMLVKRYGYKDDFQPDAKWEDVKAWLLRGNPCVAHGYFTKFGHIITIRGFNEKGWIVNDPYGEWWAWGYDTSTSGEGLTYSYGMMRDKCGPDGDLWIHYISK